MNDNLNKDISKIALDLTKHIHDRAYEAIIISGGSNQLSRALLTSAWMAQYPENPLPKIFVFDRAANHLLYKSSSGDEQNREWMSAWINKNMPELNELRDKNLCVLDEFAITGTKIREVESMLKSLGFNNLEFAVFAMSTKAEIGEGVYRGTKNDEIVMKLQEMSMHIQGEPNHRDLLEMIEESGKERRGRVLEELRDINKKMRG